jgi:hypothetical protein
MKTSRLVLAAIFLLLLLLPSRIGQSDAYGKSLPVNASASSDRPDLGISTNRLPVSSEFNPLTSPLLPQTGSCHFGITVPYGTSQYNLSILGIESYLDWSHNSKGSTVAGNIQYYRVLQVDDTSYAGHLAALPTLLSSYPGSVWIIGNEPDSEVAYQDHISAQTYAERFYAMATLIRANDPTAKVAFGSVIQPTPVRLYYLSRVIDRLTQLAESQANALGLIDIYSIHSFILNEHPIYDEQGNTISWGAGVPIGYDPATWPAYQVIGAGQTHDINLFTSRVIAFRQWMKSYGQQSKPLWITEYGSLLPTRLNVSELTTATFMEQTFDFMLGTKDPSLGNSGDDYRLVQKWLWYSLNDNVDHFGGSLYNPLTLQLTTVGDHFIKYNPSLTAVPATNPDVYIDTSNPTVKPGPYGYYKISVIVGNNVSSDRLTGVRVELFLNGNPVGSAEANIPRCSGKIPVSIDVGNLQAGQNYAFTAHVSLTSTTETDIDLANNTMVFPPITMPVFYHSMLPRISK